MAWKAQCGGISPELIGAVTKCLDRKYPNRLMGPEAICDRFWSALEEMEKAYSLFEQAKPKPKKRKGK